MKSFIVKYLRKCPMLYYSIYSTKRLLRNANNKRNLMKRIDSALSEEFHKTTQPIKLKKPTGALIEITNGCNLNCVMCNTKMSKRPIGFIKPQVFENVLQQLISIGIKNVGLHTVGETFVNNKLESLLEIANHHNFNVWISTNAQFPSRIEQIYKKFPSVAYYRFSIDGATKKSYETIRGGGKYENIVDSLEVIQKINNKKRGYRISLSIDSILSSTNIYEIPIFFEKYGKYCFPENINFAIVNGISPDPSYFRESFPFPNLIRQYIPCHMPFQSVYITYGGKVTLCCRDYDEDVIVGDIQENSLIDIWNGLQADKVRKMHLGQEKMDIRSCKLCYGPYRSISFVINEYIHSLYTYKPNIAAHSFGENIIQLLEKLDLVMANKNIGKLYGNIHDAFARINQI